MNFHLSQFQRLLAALVYLGAMWLTYDWFLASVPQPESYAVLWFYSGALVIVLGRFVVEPFFTTPADAIVNALAQLIAIGSLPSEQQHALFGYTFLQYYAYVILVVATLAIGLKDFRHPWVQSLSRVAYKLAEFGGKSQVIFSALYLSASYSFFARTGQLDLYVTALVLWICVVFFDVVGKTIHEVGKLFRFLLHDSGAELGQAIGCDNPLLYKVEIDHGKYRGPDVSYGDLVAIETQTNVGSIGMVVNRKHLLGKSWLSVYLVTEPSGGVLKLDLRSKKLTDSPRSIFGSPNKVFLLRPDSDLPQEQREAVDANPLYSTRKNFVGYITKDSNINTISFIILREHGGNAAREITEGVILKTAIYGDDTLYQVINGNTREEHLEAFDSHGFTVGLARKLGKYNHATHELETRKWMPTIYSPLFFAYDGLVTEARKAEIARDAVGRLPDTDLELPIKDLDSIVTHNTAILGILGIGKSCLAFELIKKIVAAGVKVVCIDITNQYNSPDGLQAYLGPGQISFDLDDATKAELKASKEAKANLKNENPQGSGNGGQYRDALTASINGFMASELPVKIFNPDLHAVSKGVGYKNTTLEDLSPAEKTRFIAERLFRFAMEAGESPKAKYLLVLEEAHSLVPEWNSVANEGDKNATNGTAKFIMQGRKFGLGSLVITQRTANISKSILNQCNTIFALRVFDDTGKSFLENYIGKDYADTLPTLEERHAIAIGKGLRLKQPVIMELNDRAQFVSVSPVGAVLDPAAPLAAMPAVEPESPPMADADGV